MERSCIGSKVACHVELAARNSQRKAEGNIIRFLFQLTSVELSPCVKNSS